MSTLERLKALCDEAIPSDGFKKIAQDFEIQKLTRQVLPKILAFVDEFDRMAEWQDIAAAITKDVFLARAALDEETK